MNYIDRIEVTDFRGSNTKLSFRLDQDVNFIIGRNGTGKTSLINLIAAALTVELPTLLQSDFTSILIKLRSREAKARPSISVTKARSGLEGVQITYELAERAGEKPASVNLSIADLPGQWISGLARLNWRARSPQTGESLSRAKQAVEQLTHVSWLSVHRAPASASGDAEEKFASPVDRKLHQVARDFGVYFSTLDKRAAEETDKFQQAFLLSLISPPKFSDIPSIGKLDAESEKAAIKNIFAEFKIESKQFETKLETFTTRMKKAMSNYRPKGGLPAEDFLVLIDTVRIHDVIKEWHTLVKSRAHIYEAKTDFESIVNELFFRKRMAVNSGNEPVFEDVRGRPLRLDHLSTGEKQMFILLGETLLQRRERCVFLADEPELSLHIDWQEKLVPSLRRINPNAQILFATHSPDIVGAYGENAINLESLI